MASAIAGDDLLAFVDESLPVASGVELVWRILIVDDDVGIHQVTLLAMRGIVLEGRPLEFIHAYSAAEARICLAENKDLAVVLLDVVMETEDAGLQLIRYIRDELGNHALRVILRTGQPGYAPEIDTIRSYDINDYTSKSELTRVRLFTSLTVAIRSYRQIQQQMEAQKLELSALNLKLSEAQNQLLQSEKMASVGQLAAGVAHEINNPIGFINSNLGSLKGQVEDLLRVIEAYEQAEPALAGQDDLLADIQQAKSRADLAFLKEDITNLISESLEGVQRVRKIVDNLKDFSRVDTAEWHFADLENGLESTLNIVWNEIKYKAEVKKEYGGLPEIECIASQLNQVFMNLLVNAAHAIEDHGVITLRTGFDENNVWVEVEDTGKGIRPEHLGKIFEPFFTTKPVGKGTGLGLSLAYGIVHRHHGQIEVRSELDKGTQFRVVLPCKRIPDVQAY